MGASAERLQTELSALPVSVALNPLWAQGMASSIRTGLKAVALESAGPDSVVIMLCDQPLITAAMLNQLVNVHHSAARGIVASEYEGVLGVPALFSQRPRDSDQGKNEKDFHTGAGVDGQLGLFFRSKALR